MTPLKKAIATAALATAALAATPASAALVHGFIPGGAIGSNDFINTYLPGQMVDGFYGAQLSVAGGTGMTITAEYFGAEAGYINTFTLSGGPGSTCGSPSFSHPSGTTFSPDGTPGVGSGDVKASCTAIQDGGLLNFTFLVNGGLGGVANGSNPDNSVNGPPNFFISFSDDYLLDTNIADGITASSGKYVFLFLDDGGAGPDDNHDDMVIRLTVSDGTFQIPEPGSLALVGLALLGLGATRRKSSLE